MVNEMDVTRFRRIYEAQEITPMLCVLISQLSHFCVGGFQYLISMHCFLIVYIFVKYDVLTRYLCRISDRS